MRDCDNCKHRETWAYAVPCSNCYGASNWEEIKQTNADRIRAMTDGEMAKEIAWLIVEAMKQLHPLMQLSLPK